MKSFPDKIGLTVIVGTVAIVTGCKSPPPEVEATMPKPPPAAKAPKVKEYSEFTLVSQPEPTSKSERGGWPQIVVGVPVKFLPPKKPAAPEVGQGKDTPIPAPPKPLGTAKIVDDAGHTANLGSIPAPEEGESEAHLHLTRGFSWHWSHPQLILSITGEEPKKFPMKDLPVPEVVQLPSPTSGTSLTCEIIPNLSNYGLYGGPIPKPGSPDAGLLLTGKSGLGPEQDHDTSYQVFLHDTQSAAGLGFQFRDVDPAAGLNIPAKYVPFRFAEATKRVRLDIRKTNNIVEEQDVQFPGCKLVSKFNSTGFQVDKTITVKGSNGWTFTLPAQYFGPVRETHKDTKAIEIKMDFTAPEVTSSSPAAEATPPAGGRRRGRSMDRLRTEDFDREKASVAVDMVSPTPADLGLLNVWLSGKSFTGPKSSAPVKYGDFTLHLKIKTLSVKELSVGQVVLDVNKTSRSVVASSTPTKP